MTIKTKLVESSKFCKDILNFKRIEFGAKSHSLTPAIIEFHTSLQPLYHKNFDLVAQSFKEFISNNYKIYILTDNEKQTDRIKAIFEDRNDDIVFTPVLKTLHEGFADDDMKQCYFTDHQIFYRFHK